MKVFLVALLVGLLTSYGFAAAGPSLDLRKKSLNKATYSELVLESVPPTSKEVLPDGSMIAYWNVLTQEGGDMNQYKVCIFNSKGVLTRDKWKRGPFLGGDSTEGSDGSSSSHSHPSLNNAGSWPKWSN